MGSLKSYRDDETLEQHDKNYVNDLGHLVLEVATLDSNGDINQTLKRVTDPQTGRRT